MNAGPYGAIRIVQHLGGVRSEDEAAEWTVPVSGHHDEAGMMAVGEFDDAGSGVALEHDALDGCPRELSGEKAGKFEAGLPGAGARQFGEQVSGRVQRSQIVMGQRHHMEQCEVGMKVFRQRLGGTCGGDGALREIDGQKNAGQRTHSRLLLNRINRF